MTQQTETIEPQRDDAPHPSTGGERTGDVPRDGIPLDVFWARLDPLTA